MNLIKVREIRGPRNEFLQKSAKSEVRGMNFHKSPRNPSPRNKCLQKSAKSEVRGMNFYKSLQNPKFLGIIRNAYDVLLYHKLLWLFMLLLMARGTSSGSCPMEQFWAAALVFCRLAAYFGLSTTCSHISPMWPGTTPITSNTLQGSCRKQKAIYYAKPMQNYEITIARKIFFKLKDTSEHSLTI